MPYGKMTLIELRDRLNQIIADAPQHANLPILVCSSDRVANGRNRGGYENREQRFFVTCASSGRLTSGDESFIEIGARSRLPKNAPTGIYRSQHGPIPCRKLRDIGDKVAVEFTEEIGVYHVGEQRAIWGYDYSERAIEATIASDFIATCEGVEL